MIEIIIASIVGGIVLLLGVRTVWLMLNSGLGMKCVNRIEGRDT